MRVLSLFSGLEGLGFRAVSSAGLAAKVRVEQAVEISPFRQQILKKMGLNVCPDITKFVPNRNFDVVVSGSPCTQTSIAAQIRGRRSGFEGEDSGLWWHNLRVVHQARPTYFLWENPAGCLYPTPGRRFSPLTIVVTSLRSLGYSIGWFTVPAWVVGAPHARWRTFAIAVRGRVNVAAAILEELPRATIASPDPSEPVWVRESNAHAKANNAVLAYINSAYRRGWWAKNPLSGWVIAPRRSIQGRQDVISAIGDSCVPQQAAIAWKILLKLSPGRPFKDIEGRLPPSLDTTVGVHWRSSGCVPIAKLPWFQLQGTMPRFGALSSGFDKFDYCWGNFGGYLLNTPVARSPARKGYNRAGQDNLSMAIRGFARLAMTGRNPDKINLPKSVKQLALSLSKYRTLEEVLFVDHPCIRCWMMGIQ